MNLQRFKLRQKYVLVAILVIVTVVSNVTDVSAYNVSEPESTILYVGYADLDADGKEDDVIAFVMVIMPKGEKNIAFDATISKDDVEIYTISGAHDKHQLVILYRFRFYNVVFEKGWYQFTISFHISMGDYSWYLTSTVYFDPPGEDEDYPPGGDYTPGP